ncbi:MAG: hypothetical protein IPK82_35740 [Polyangiaceae bacterium]|nr:hypothetical protein [Polyangiaceae bacterium]
MSDTWDQLYKPPEAEKTAKLSESDVVAELIQRTTALRKRFLWFTLAASLAGALLSAGVPVLTGAIVGKVIGAFFAAGALGTFGVSKFITNKMARGAEHLWISRLAKQHNLSPESLKEAMGMFD